MSKYSVEEVRARFEAWWRSTGSSFELIADPNWPKGYAVSQVQCSWLAWQVAYAERIKADEGAVPVAQGEVVYQRHLAVPGYWEDITREQWEKAQRSDTRVLYTAQPRAVPDGMVLVPREPTETMLYAWLNHDSTRVLQLNDDLREAARADWAAMLATTPSPGESNSKSADCSGDPSSCPDNEGHGCYCSDLRRAGESA